MSDAKPAAAAQKPFYKKRWFFITAAAVILVVIASVTQSPASKKSPATTQAGAGASSKTTTLQAGEDDNLNGPGAPTVAGSVVAPDSGAHAGTSACRSGDPLANVYHPNRLRVMKSCTTISGVVKTVRSEDDGDVHFDVALDPTYTSMLTRANSSYQHGWLVVEIVPADEPGCTPGQPPRPAHGTYDYGICTGADESPPAVGSHVYVTGPYVLDEDHSGWAEVHPAWAISSTVPTTTTVPPPTTTAPPTTEAPAIAAPTAPQPAPEPPPTTSPPTTSSPPPPSSGAWCTASAAPSNDGYPGDYEVYVHSNQPDTEATASDAGDTWSHETDSTGYADIRLYNTSPGEPIGVTVGAASCSTTA